MMANDTFGMQRRASHGTWDHAAQERRSRARMALHEFLPNCTFDIFQRGRSGSPETRNLGIRRYEPHPSQFSHGLFKSTVGCIFRCKAKHPPFRLCTILETDAVGCKARLIWADRPDVAEWLHTTPCWLSFHKVSETWQRSAERQWEIVLPLNTLALDPVWVDPFLNRTVTRMGPYS